MSKYTLSVVDASGAVVKRNIEGVQVPATINYSLATYIVATDSSLAKSLYAFGSAVRKVRDDLASR